MALEDTIDTVNNANLKSIAEIPSWSSVQKTANDVSHAKRVDQLVEMAMQNMINYQQRINTISESYIGRLVDTASSIDPVEAVATAKLFKGESDSSILSLLTSLAAGQQEVKVAQSTPVETAMTQATAYQNAIVNQNAQTSSHIASMNQSTLNSMHAVAQVLSKLAHTMPDVTGKQVPAPGT
jgi:hypothetical protein